LPFVCRQDVCSRNHCPRPVPEEKTAGGIVLPDTAKEKPQRGKVIAAGPGKMLNDGKRGKIEIKVGDEVFYGKYAGTEVEVDGVKYVIIRENDVLGIIE
jgi:chaperonin GroES